MGSRRAALCSAALVAIGGSASAHDLPPVPASVEAEIAAMEPALQSIIEAATSGP